MGIYFASLGFFGVIFIICLIRLCKKKTNGFKVRDWILTLVADCGILTTLIIATICLSKVNALTLVGIISLIAAIVCHSIALCMTVTEKQNLLKKPIDANKK